MKGSIISLSLLSLFFLCCGDLDNPGLESIVVYETGWAQPVIASDEYGLARFKVRVLGVRNRFTNTGQVPLNKVSLTVSSPQGKGQLVDEDSKKNCPNTLEKYTAPTKTTYGAGLQFQVFVEENGAETVIDVCTPFDLTTNRYGEAQFGIKIPKRDQLTDQMLVDVFVLAGYDFSNRTITITKGTSNAPGVNTGATTPTTEDADATTSN